jgi:tRNA(His) guanylyltransferase
MQVDTHINNQYNTCFWALRQQGAKSPTEAQAILRGTLVGAKNELLFSEFGINYNELPEQFKKGSIVVWVARQVVAKVRPDGTEVVRTKREPVVLHEDLILDDFWERHPEILSPS